MYNSTDSVQIAIAKGKFDPNIRLTNMAMAYFQSLDNRPHKALFPILPVKLSTSSYYIFNKEDLLRDDVRRKPEFGKVDTAIISHSTATYACEVDQIIMGINQIAQVDYDRTGAPSFIRAEAAKSRSIAQKIAIHNDIMFADSYFKKGAWTDEWTGGATADDTTKKFIKFSDANSTPIQFFRARATDMQQRGRKANKLGLGVNTFNALINHPDILSRVEGQGSTQNPAMANERVLAQLFGFDKVVVFDSIANMTKLGVDDDLQFICDKNAALMVYAPDTPSMEEPSAGYTFAWDMLGDGQFMPILRGEGEFGTHSEYIEGLMASDMKKTADDLGTFLADCV